MEYDDSIKEIRPDTTLEAEFPQLPPAFDETVLRTSLALDDLLGQPEPPTGALEAAFEAHRNATLKYLWNFHQPIPEFDLSWPLFLYIPRDATARDYWPGDAPPEQRYTYQWTPDPGASANRASIANGATFSFGQVIRSNAGRSVSSESRLGVFYTPTMTSGVVELGAHAICDGEMKIALEMYPEHVVAGEIVIKAELLLVAWQRQPDGSYGLRGIRPYTIATFGPRDQSFGPEKKSFLRSFDGPDLATRFVIQRPHTYLFAVVNRVTIISTLSSNQSGRPLPEFEDRQFKVWGWMNCIVPQITIKVKETYVP